MLAQCPQCRTVFRLALSLLETAQGRVRCGQCGAVFDAAGDLPGDIQKLLSQHPLNELEPALDDGPDVLLHSGQDDEAVPEFQLSEEELEDALVEAAPSFPDREADPVDASSGDDEALDSTADTAENEILNLEVAATRAQEDITLEGQKVSIFNEETGEYRTFATDAAAESAPDEVDENDGLADADSPAEAQPPAELSLADFAILTGSHRALHENRRSARRLWLLGSLLLGLALAAQVVHFNRTELARLPSLGPLLSSLYAHLGLRLDPAWDVAAYRIRQWGAAADANGGLRIRASVFNTAERPQPYPLLRLTLQDRFGEKVGSRNLQPHDYLPSLSADTTGRLLGPGQRIDADIAIVDPGKNAIGFELDACLSDEHNSLRCANDLRQKAASP